MRTVEVVPHNPEWQYEFEVQSRCIADALGENVIEVYHIGSTSIAGIYAKSIIDLMVAVRAIAQVDLQTSSLVEQGYETMGEYGIPGRRYFRKENAAGIRTHHVHMFEVGSAQIERHLAFRDYMRAHPKDAQAYSNLKRQLAKAHPTDIEAYMDGKDGFIQAIDAKAVVWRSQMDDLTKAIEAGKQRGRSKFEHIGDILYFHDAVIQKVKGKYRVHVSRIREQDMASEQYEIYFTREVESLPLAISCLKENSPIKFSELEACKGQRIFNANLLEENDT